MTSVESYFNPNATLSSQVYFERGETLYDLIHYVVESIRSNTRESERPFLGGRLLEAATYYQQNWQLYPEGTLKKIWRQAGGYFHDTAYIDYALKLSHRLSSKARDLHAFVLCAPDQSLSVILENILKKQEIGSCFHEPLYNRVFYEWNERQQTMIGVIRNLFENLLSLLYGELVLRQAFNLLRVIDSGRGRLTMIDSSKPLPEVLDFTAAAWLTDEELKSIIEGVDSYRFCLNLRGCFQLTELFIDTLKEWKGLIKPSGEQSGVWSQENAVAIIDEDAEEDAEAPDFLTGSVEDLTQHACAHFHLAASSLDEQT